MDSDLRRWIISIL